MHVLKKKRWFQWWSGRSHFNTCLSVCVLVLMWLIWSFLALLLVFSSFFSFFSQNLELTDTVFMVLRHRTRQITWLHVYHHASMVLLGDYSNNVRWPSIALYLGVNSIIHIILYFYYGLTAAWPNAARPSWRRRLTEAQLLQFFVLLVFVVEGYLHHGFCPYGIAFDLTMIVLFGNFYYFAYLRPKSAKMAEGQKRDWWWVHHPCFLFVFCFVDLDFLFVIFYFVFISVVFSCYFPLGAKALLLCTTLWILSVSVFGFCWWEARTFGSAVQDDWCHGWALFKASSGCGLSQKHMLLTT